MVAKPHPLQSVQLAAAKSQSECPSWSKRYGERHRLDRIIDFPDGIVGPTKVRLYRRHGHFVLQWWDPAAKANLSDRVDGDLVAAITRARQIEERLLQFKSSGHIAKRRLEHSQLVEAYLNDLQQRADAGDIDPATVRRYASALTHYLVFCKQAGMAAEYPNPAMVNRAFRLKLSAFLHQRQVSPNGWPQAQRGAMKGRRFVLDTVRALYEWAAHPERGHLLPEGFRNPFLRLAEESVLKGDALAEPDITIPMAVGLIDACDAFQLQLFVPMLLFGLRAAEPCFLFLENLDPDWLRVPCHIDLGYRTKGRRDKRFPLLEELQEFWARLRGGRQYGLLFERRSVLREQERAELRGYALADLISIYQRRCGAETRACASQREAIRDQLLHDAGGLKYDHIQKEFSLLAHRLNWPQAATLKDLRHLFATTMNNAAMPESYRRYLMGHSPGRAAIVAYTHLNEMRRHYQDAVRREWQEIIKAIRRRLKTI